MTYETTTPDAAPSEDTLQTAVEPTYSDTDSPPEDNLDDSQASDSDQSDENADSDTSEQTTDEETTKAALRQADYTRKTQEIAEIRKALTERTAKLDQYVSHGEALVNALAGEFQAEFQGVDWGRLAAEDPAQYVQKRHAFDERQRKLQLAVGQLQAAKQQQSELESQNVQQRLIEEQRTLIEKLPEWKDAKKAAAESAELREYLTKSGYQSDEVNGVTDHRAVILARKAMLYDRMMSRVPKAQPVPQAPPPPPSAPSKAKAAPNPEKMSMDQWLKWRNAQLRQQG